MSDDSDSDSEQSPMSLLRLPPSRDLSLVKKLPPLGTAAAGRASPMIREWCINKREPQATQPAAQTLMVSIAHLLTKENAMYKIERDIYATRRMGKLFGKKIS
jgi:hypothetical protein